MKVRLALGRARADFRRPGPALCFPMRQPVSTQVGVDGSVIGGFEFAALLPPIAIDDDRFEALLHGRSSEDEVDSQAMAPMK